MRPIDADELKERLRAIDTFPDTLNTKTMDLVYCVINSIPDLFKTDHLGSDQEKPARQKE